MNNIKNMLYSFFLNKPRLFYVNKKSVLLGFDNSTDKSVRGINIADYLNYAFEIEVNSNAENNKEYKIVFSGSPKMQPEIIRAFPVGVFESKKDAEDALSVLHAKLYGIGSSILFKLIGIVAAFYILGFIFSILIGVNAANQISEAQVQNLGQMNLPPMVSGQGGVQQNTQKIQEDLARKLQEIQANKFKFKENVDQTLENRDAQAQQLPEQMQTPSNEADNFLNGLNK